MRVPSHRGAVLLSVLVSVLVALAPCQARAFPDDDVWVTSGIIAGITLGACVVVVLLAGLFTDLKGETDDPGEDWAAAMDRTFGRIPLDLSCPALREASRGFCPPPGPGPILAIEPNGQAEPIEGTLRRKGFKAASPLLQASDRAGLSFLPRSPQAPSPMPVVIWENSPFHGEDEGRSGRLF